MINNKAVNKEVFLWEQSDDTWASIQAIYKTIYK